MNCNSIPISLKENEMLNRWDKRQIKQKFYLRSVFDKITENIQ